MNKKLILSILLILISTGSAYSIEEWNIERTSLEVPFFNPLPPTHDMLSCDSLLYVPSAEDSICIQTCVLTADTDYVASSYTLVRDVELTGFQPQIKMRRYLNYLDVVIAIDNFYERHYSVIAYRYDTSILPHELIGTKVLHSEYYESFSYEIESLLFYGDFVGGLYKGDPTFFKLEFESGSVNRVEFTSVPTWKQKLFVTNHILYLTTCKNLLDDNYNDLWKLDPSTATSTLLSARLPFSNNVECDTYWLKATDHHLWMKDGDSENQKIWVYDFTDPDAPFCTDSLEIAMEAEHFATLENELIVSFEDCIYLLEPEDLTLNNDISSQFSDNIAFTCFDSEYNQLITNRTNLYEYYNYNKTEKSFFKLFQKKRFECISQIDYINNRYYLVTSSGMYTFKREGTEIYDCEVVENPFDNNFDYVLASRSVNYHDDFNCFISYDSLCLWTFADEYTAELQGSFSDPDIVFYNSNQPINQTLARDDTLLVFGSNRTYKADYLFSFDVSDPAAIQVLDSLRIPEKWDLVQDRINPIQNNRMLLVFYYYETAMLLNMTSYAHPQVVASETSSLFKYLKSFAYYPPTDQYICHYRGGAVKFFDAGINSLPEYRYTLWTHNSYPTEAFLQDDIVVLLDSKGVTTFQILDENESVKTGSHYDTEYIITEGLYLNNQLLGTASFRSYIYLYTLDNALSSPGSENHLLPQQVRVTAYPNPFNAMTRVGFTLPETGQIQLNVYDLLGRQVAKLADQVYSAGSYTLPIDATQLSSGVYFVRLKTQSGGTMTKRIVLVK